MTTGQIMPVVVDGAGNATNRASREAPPLGVCCPDQVAGNGVVCIDDSSEAECTTGRWREGETCLENHFDPPCGTHACCLPDDTCSDMTSEACGEVCGFLRPEFCGVWGPGRFCGVDGQYCPVFVCNFATGDCLTEAPCADGFCSEHECNTDLDCQEGELNLGPTSYCIHGFPGPPGYCSSRKGCGQTECCDSVCTSNPFCCEVAWDYICAQVAGAAVEDCDGADCNDNQVPDIEDIESGFSSDCDGNNRPDECDIASGALADCDQNGQPDACQISFDHTVTCMRCSKSHEVCSVDDPCNSEPCHDCGPFGGSCSVELPASECNEGPFYCVDDCDSDCNYDGLLDSCHPVGPAIYVSSEPDSSEQGDQSFHETLWRTGGNVVRIYFHGAISNPDSGDVEIRELLSDGKFGEDLSASFTFTLEERGGCPPDVLRIGEIGTILENEKWYAIINSNWRGMPAFERHFAVVYGDANGDGHVQLADLAFINARIGQPTSSDQDRHDVNGDNLIQFADLSVTNGFAAINVATKPTGH